MSTDHPITPPPELVQEWWEEADQYQDDPKTYFDHVATEAARWGADQELNECCHLLRLQGFDVVDDLRAARRPKPPSLKEQALESLHHLEAGCEPNIDLLRRALEALDD